MSDLENDEKIKTIIKNIIKKLNKCVKNWYSKILPKFKMHFTPCCNNEELELLLKCYKIGIKHIKTDNTDDFIKALIVYYYVIMVFENYVHHYIDEKYLKIVKEEDSKVPDNKIFTDNIDNIYAYFYNKNDKDKKYIEIHEPFLNKKCYVNNIDRKSDPYIYEDKEGKTQIIMEDHMNCLDDILDTEESKNYYKLLYSNNEEGWVSDIRRKVLNMNEEEFKGGKKTKKNTKKSKKTKKIRKYKNKS